MTYRLITSSCFALALGFFGCNRTEVLKVRVPKVVTVDLGSSAAPSAVSPGDTLQFTFPNHPQFWVKFATKTPCETGGQTLQYGAGSPPKCIIRTPSGPPLPAIGFSYGTGVFGSPGGPNEPFPSRVVSCNGGCP